MFVLWYERKLHNYRVSSGLLTAFCKPDSSTWCLRNVSDLGYLLNILAGKTLGFCKIGTHDAHAQALHESQFRIWFEFGLIYHNVKQ